MPATLARLVEIRSQLVEQALLYFERMVADAIRLPAYFPEHLRITESGKTPFDDIRQVVQVVDRKAHEEWLREHEAGLREQARAAGLEDPRIYAPKRSRVEASGREAEREPRNEVPKPPPPPVIWDEHAGERFKRAVILGDPGFGKTWLLRFEARRLARAAMQGLIEHTRGVDDIIVPIFMRLSDLNRALAGDKTLAEALLPSRRSEYPALFLNWLKGAIEGGRCVVLLDAFDEVKADQRQALCERLAESLSQAPYNRLRVLITSRIVGYPGSPFREGSAEELELLAFDPPHIEAFTGVWFSGKAAGRPFLDLLRAQHQIQGLARIPLMLTLLCKTFQETKAREPFPTRRVELYERCLKGLLLFWKKEKDAKDTDPGYVEKLLPLLAAVSYRLFDEGYEQFPESLLRARLRSLLEALPTDHVLRRRARQEAKLASLKSRYGQNEMVKASEILDELEAMMDGDVEESHGIVAELKRDGLLVPANESEDPSLFFLHRTFHEYLAAYHLARISAPDGCQWADIAPIVSRKAWLPERREVIVLLAGLLEDPGPLLEMLGNPKRTRLNPYGDDVYRHRLTLACLCLREIIPTTLKKHSVVLDSLTTQAMDLWFECSAKQWWVWRDRRKLFLIDHLGSALPALAGFNCYWGDRPLFTRLIAMFDKIEDMCASAVSAFEAIGPVAATPDIIEALVSRLGNSSELIRDASESALGRMAFGATTPHIMSRLIEEIRDREENLCLKSAYRFPQNGYGVGRAVVAKLVECLSDNSMRIRLWATKAIGYLGPAAVTPAVLDALVNQLGDGDRRMAFESAATLGDLGPAAATPAVLDALVGGFKHGEMDVRYKCIKSIGKFGLAAVTTAVLDALVKQLGDSDLRTAFESAATFGELGPTAATPAVLDALVASLRHRWTESSYYESFGMPLRRFDLGDYNPPVEQCHVDRKVWPSGSHTYCNFGSKFGVGRGKKSSLSIKRSYPR